MTTIIDLPKDEKQSGFGLKLKKYQGKENFARTMAFRQKVLKEKQDESQLSK